MSQTARGYDARGNEHVLPKASKDVVVEDASGVERKLFKDKVVPLDLLEAYKEAVGESDEDDEDLSKLSREDLNAQAETVGVENPEQLPNKDAVIEAIETKRGES